MSEERWQPIDTAPKTDYILVFPALMGVPLVAIWCDKLEVWRAAMTENTTPFPPTHWMPLPDPPTPSPAKEG
jgi:hypothetical protein